MTPAKRTSLVDVLLSLLINFNRYLPSELYVSIIHFTSTEPVKETLSTSMWLDIAAPAVGP